MEILLKGFRVNLKCAVSTKVIELGVTNKVALKVNKTGDQLRRGAKGSVR